jgi:hypothetical protein
VIGDFTGMTWPWGLALMTIHRTAKGDLREIDTEDRVDGMVPTTGLLRGLSLERTFVTSKIPSQ